MLSAEESKDQGLAGRRLHSAIRIFNGICELRGKVGSCRLGCRGVAVCVDEEGRRRGGSHPAEDFLVSHKRSYTILTFVF